MREDKSEYPSDEPVLISVFTQKGGVGKTTSTFNMACILAKNYQIKVLMVDADPQCNLTGISLKKQLLRKAGHSSLSSHGKSKAKNKGLIKKKFHPSQTRGDGDCAFHAFGEKKESEYVLESVHLCRSGVKNHIIKMINNKGQNQLRELVQAGIKDLIMLNRNVGKEIKAVRQAYLKFEEEKDLLAPYDWDEFEAKLNQYPDIIQCINTLSEGKECKNFRAQYRAALSEEDWELEARIMSIPELYRAYQEYNRRTHLEFPWDDYINTPTIIEEYANYIGKPNEWLLPHELGIIAIVFKKTVEVYPDLKANPQIYNEGKGEGEPIRVLFNAEARHFERLEEGAPQLMLDDELILSDQLDEFYEDDQYFSQPYGESPGSREQKERLEYKKKSKIDNLYKAFSIISTTSLKKQSMTEVCQDIAGKTIVQKLQFLDPSGNLYILPSSMDLYLIDNTLTSIIGGAPPAGINTDLAFMGVEYIRALAKHHGFRIVLIDLSPNIGGLNQSLFLFSDYFIMPGTPSFFTVQALASLARALPKWIGTYSKIDEERPLSKLLMVYIQKAKSVSDATTSAPQNWIDKIKNTLRNKLLPVLQNIRNGEMLIKGERFDKLPTISVTADGLLEKAETSGLPIAFYNTYPEIKVTVKDRISLAKYQEEFNELVKWAFSILVKTDDHLKDFREKFLSTTDEIHQKVEKCINTARNADFLQLITEEFKQKPEIGSDDFYPQSVTSLLVFIYSIKQKLPPQFHLTYPYSYPQESELSNFKKEIKSDLKLMLENEDFLYFIFCFYASGKWIIMKIDLFLNVQKQKKEIQEIKFFCGDRALPQEAKMAALLINFFHQKIKASDKEDKLEKKQADQLIEIKKKMHPANIIRSVIDKKFAPSALIIRKNILGQAIKLQPTKAELKKFVKAYNPLHQKYIANLAINFEGLRQKETGELYKNLLNLLMKVTPQFIHQDFSNLTQIIFLHALLKSIPQVDEEKEEEEKEGKKTEKELKKEQKEMNKAKREQEKKISTFLRILFDRSIGKPESKPLAVIEAPPPPLAAPKVRKVSGDITTDRQSQSASSVSSLANLSVLSTNQRNNNLAPSATRFSRPG